MRTLHIDIETYSSVDLGKAGLYKYAQSPDFEILLIGYSLDGGPVEVLDLTALEPDGVLPPELISALFDEDTVKTAHNAAFEIYCLSRYFGQGEDFAARWARQWRCSMLHGQYLSYPASLEAMGAALGLTDGQQKMVVGKALIRYFCKPCAPTKKNGGRTRNLPEHDPDKWRLFMEYNRRDVEAEMEIERRLAAFPVPEAVQEQWLMDMAINLRGVGVDRGLVQGALEISARHSAALTAEAARITGLSNPNSVAQLKGWLEEETGEECPDLRRDTVAAMIETRCETDEARRVLEIRQELSKSSNKKYEALAAAVGEDGRIRGVMAFYGASRTGREAGRIVQPQNLPHDTVPMESVGRELVRQGHSEGVRLVYGSLSRTLSALIRTALVPEPGCAFVDADFSAIEARVIAWLAGEKWVLEVFRTHGKIYEATASQMFGVPLEKIKKGEPEYAYRAKGKVATLALGYQGGPGALINMGALNNGLTEEELPDIVDRWRASNKNIVRFWAHVERAATEAVISGRTSEIGLTGGARLVFARKRDEANGLDFMTVELPSGRTLYYAQPDTTLNRFGRPSLCYMGQSGKSGKWAQTETYGGKLAENITQAVARDLLFDAMARLEAAGHRIVFTVHDEIVLEEPEDEADLDEVVQIMSRTPDWAPGLPLAADGWVGKWYHKD